MSSDARLRYLTNFRNSSGLSTTNVVTPKASAVRMSPSRLIGCVWMQRCGVDAEPAHQLDFAVGRQIEIRALVAQRADHGGLRQRLQRVMQIDAGQRRREAPVLAAHPLASMMSSGEP